MSGNPLFDFTDDEPDGPPRRRKRDRDGADAPGVVALVFGCVAGVMLLISPVTCGLTVWAALALSLVGFFLSFFGRGNLRVGSLTLNLLVLLFSVIAEAVVVAVNFAIDRAR